MHILCGTILILIKIIFLNICRMCLNVTTLNNPAIFFITRPASYKIPIYIFTDIIIRLKTKLDN